MEFPDRIIMKCPKCGGKELRTEYYKPFRNNMNYDMKEFTQEICNRRCIKCGNERFVIDKYNNEKARLKRWDELGKYVNIRRKAYEQIKGLKICKRVSSTCSRCGSLEPQIIYGKRYKTKEGIIEEFMSRDDSKFMCHKCGYEWLVGYYYYENLGRE